MFCKQDARALHCQAKMILIYACLGKHLKDWGAKFGSPAIVLLVEWTERDHH